MAIKKRAFKRRLRLRQRGFTLIETLIIVLVIGIMAAIGAPSFGTMLDAAKVNQTVSDMRISLQETQREAIRKNQECTFKLNQTSSGKKAEVQGNCLSSGAPTLSDGVTLASNISPVTTATPATTPYSPTVTPQYQQPGNNNSSPRSPLQSLEINFGTLGGAEFTVQSSVQLPNVPTDPSGKIVAFVANKDNVQKKCVAVSSTLGLTRIGTYTGSMEPADITDHGICTALDWQEQ